MGVLTSVNGKFTEVLCVVSHMQCSCLFTTLVFADTSLLCYLNTPLKLNAVQQIIIDGAVVEMVMLLSAYISPSMSEVRQ